MLPLPETSTPTRRNIARKYKLSGFPDPGQFLHIRCGNDILGMLGPAGIPGDGVKWADPLCEGPVHRHGTDAARWRERAAYLSARLLIPMTETYREMKGDDWRVDQCVHYGETTLWFEADMFDQMILIYLLSRLAPLSSRTRLSLVCIGGFPGVDRFIGLGQLFPAQLATLWPTRRPVRAGQFRLAARAWDALRSDTPQLLSRIGRMRSSALPFLPAAVRRYLAEYPSVRNGLGRTEQLALEALTAGDASPMSLFPMVQAREPRPYLGDSMFYGVLRGLAASRSPAIAGVTGRIAKLRDPEFANRPIRLTDTGRQLLANEIDWCAVSGVVRQLGGVTLRGPRPRWRWDTRRRAIVERRSR